MLSVRFRTLALVAYLLLLLPIAVFCAGWLRWYYALCAVALLAAGFVWLFRADYMRNTDRLSIPVPHAVGILLVVGFWTAYSGSCGIGCQGWDIPWRNIIFEDLVTHSWPVTYESGYAMAYYVAFWMLPALVGKIGGLTAGFVALWAYETLIVATAIGLFSCLIKAHTPSRFWMVAMVFMLFSGLSLVGAAVVEMGNAEYTPFKLGANEGYLDGFYTGQSTNFYYRSSIDMIGQSYNQTVVWLAIPLMLQNRKIHSFMFLGLILAPFSPWACMGIVPLMLVLGVQALVRYRRSFRKPPNTPPALSSASEPPSFRPGGAPTSEAEKPSFGPHSQVRTLPWALKEVFSLPNVAALLVVAIVFGSFFLAGSHFNGISEGTATGADFAIEQEGSFGLLRFDLFPLHVWAGYILFVLCDFGLFCIFLVRRNRRDPLFWGMLVWLLVCPFIWVGTIYGRDFCMNASVPALCVLMFFIMQKLDLDVLGKPMRFKNFAFTAILLIAFEAPVLHMAYQTSVLFENRSLTVQTHDIGIADTFEGTDIGRISNFVSVDPDETFFYRYLAK